MRRAGRAVAAVLSLAALLAACGDDDATTATTTTTTSMAETEPVAEGGDGGDEGDEVDPTARLSNEQSSEPLAASEVRIGSRVESELSGDAGDGSSVGESSVTASEATAVERTLSDLGATRTAEGLVVTLPETVLFDFDEAEIRSDAAATLEEVAEVIAYHREATVEIQGHTDGRGDAGYNQELSERRAEAVRDELVGTHGVESRRLEPIGFGASRPVAPEAGSDGRDDPDGRQRNRRVEILLREV